MNIRWKIHVSTSLLLVFYMLTGRFADYVILVISLLIHEGGHLFAAKLARVKVESVCFYMYGADMRFQRNFITPSQQLTIAIGGPLATLIVLAICMIKREGVLDGIIQMQQLLLLVNLCPVWPLDGGRMVQAICSLFFTKGNVDSLLLNYSLIVAIVIVIVATLSMQPFFILLFIVVCQQIIAEKKQLSLQHAYKRIVLKQQ